MNVRAICEGHFVLPLPPAEAVSLFTPEGERLWAGSSWDPIYAIPQAAHDASARGTVFTTQSDSGSATWIVLGHGDNEMRYARVIPDRIAGTITVTCTEAVKPDQTRVSVTYDVTSLSPEGTEFVKELEATYDEFLDEWRQQIVAVAAAEAGRASGQPLGATLTCDEDTLPAGAGDRDSAKTVRIREAQIEDANALLALKGALDQETTLMLLEPGERTSAEAEVAEQLRATAARPNSIVLVAEAADDLVGYVEAIGGEFRRNRETSHVVIGVRESHAGQGIGRTLLAELERWARANDIRRLELTVMTHNDRAVGLYTKMGYRVEGTRQAALLVDGSVTDEFWMAKILR